MKVNLTDNYLRNLQAPATGRLEVSDTKRPGLRFRLTAAGKASWMFEKRVKGGMKRKHTLGTYPSATLADARKQALELEAEANAGIDRVAITAARTLADERAAAARLTVGELLAKYDELHLTTLRGRYERLRQLQQSFEGKLDLPIADIQTKHLQAIVDGHTARGHKIMANRVRAALVAFTAWSHQRGYLDNDVGLRVAKAAKETARERVMAVDEVRAVYTACDALGPLWGPLFKLTVLTGQRRKEIAALRWDEVELDARRIVKPGSQTKNGKPHITHLSDEAVAVLKAVKRQDSDWVFTTTGKTPVSGISKAKARLDALLGDTVAPWRLHDIRTALATALAESGETEAIVDRILNHSASGSAPSAVARVYQRGELLPQRARALDKWADIVTGEEAKVINLHGGAA